MFISCASGNYHIGKVKHYRHYVNEKDSLKCKCGTVTIGKWFWGDGEIPYKINEKCGKCNSVYKHPKRWILKCSECKPKEDK